MEAATRLWSTAGDSLHSPACLPPPRGRAYASEGYFQNIMENLQTWTPKDVVAPDVEPTSDVGGDDACALATPPRPALFRSLQEKIDSQIVDQEAPGSISSFINMMTVPLQSPLVSSPPRLRVAKLRADTREDSELVPRRSARLAAKSKFRASKPDAQARKVLMKKLGEDVPTEETDEATFDEYHVTFKLPLDETRREGMRELFPGRHGRRTTAVEDV